MARQRVYADSEMQSFVTMMKPLREKAEKSMAANERCRKAHNASISATKRVQSAAKIEKELGRKRGEVAQVVQIEHDRVLGI